MTRMNSDCRPRQTESTGANSGQRGARTLALLLTLVLLGVKGPTAAQTPEAVGGDFQVNSYTPGGQGWPDVATSLDSDFIVVWQSYTSAGSDDDWQSTQGRRFAADGTPLGDDFQVNTYTTDKQKKPALAIQPDGGFIVVWWSYGSAGSDTDRTCIQGRRFAADGTPLGDDFQVNSYTTHYQVNPDVATGPDGEFVVVWRSDRSAGSDTDRESIQGRRFAADGTPLGDDFQVNTYTTHWQFHPAVAIGPGGEFVVVWESYGSAGSDPWRSIQGRRFAADGTPLGDDFQVNSYTTHLQVLPAVATGPDGEFIVVWESVGSAGTDTDGRSIQGRRFDADGTPLGNDFQVNTSTTGRQWFSALATGPDGEFVALWESSQSAGSDSDGRSIQGRLFAADGRPLSDDFQINTYTTGEQREPSAAFGPNGNLIAVWFGGSDGSDTSSSSIQGRIFPPDLIFANGFESGDTSAWSGTVP